MKKKSWHLDRSTLLKGSGVALALPFMNAMSIAKEGESTKSLPKRAAFISFPNGVSLPKIGSGYDDWHWFPKGGGKDYEFRLSQDSLNPYRDEITVISGLSNPANRKMDPHVGPTGLLTTKGIDRKTIVNSISIDQKIANYYGRKTQLSSLVMSTNGGTGRMGRAQTLSYDKDGKAIPAMSHLKEIYGRMYLSNSPEARDRLNKQEFLLNAVYENAKDMKKRLGKEDQSTLDDYLSSITDLEKKVSNDKAWASRASKLQPPNMALDAQIDDPEKYIQSIYELTYLAFRSDITRVSTYMLASEPNSQRSENLSLNIGLDKGLHSITHNVGKGDGYERWGKWDQFIAKQLSYFIKRLKETKEGNGTLLDRTLIFQASATSKTHHNYNYPIIVAGGKKLGHQAGQFITYDEEKNALSNLYVKIANAVGVPIENFGDSTGISMSEVFS